MKQPAHCRDTAAAALSLTLCLLGTASQAEPIVTASLDGFQQAAVFGSAWRYDTTGSSTELPVATGGTFHPDQPLSGGPSHWSASTGLQRTERLDGIDPLTGLPRPVLINQVGADLTFTGTNDFADGVHPYQVAASSRASATHGVLSASAQGLRQVTQTDTSFETMGAYTSASAFIAGSFIITVDRATALALADRKPYLDIELTLQHNLVGNAAFASESFSATSVNVGLSARSLTPDSLHQQNHTITTQGRGASTFAMRYELSELLVIAGHTCVSAEANPSFFWVPCLFSVGLDASINAISGAGSSEAVASMKWSVSDDVTRVQTFATAWGSPIPAVPEPQTVSMILAGLAVVGGRAWAKRRQN